MRAREPCRRRAPFLVSSPSSRDEVYSKSFENQKNVTSSKGILFPKEPAASLNPPFQTLHWPPEKSGSHQIVPFQHFPKE